MTEMEEEKSVTKVEIGQLPIIFTTRVISISVQSNEPN